MQRNIIEPNFNQPCNNHLEPCAEVYSSSVVYKCKNDVEMLKFVEPNIDFCQILNTFLK